MRKALIVGIDYYKNCRNLGGCIIDAQNVAKELKQNGDGTLNFHITTVLVDENKRHFSRKDLKSLVEELFCDRNELALFYFAGHGHREKTGGYLITPETAQLDEGFPMSELISLANQSPALNRVIILDCCHSGEVGNIASIDSYSLLSEGVTILAASQANQYAVESNNGGVFTGLLVEALRGGATSLTGDILLSRVYAYIDQSLPAWEQRPVFKASTTGFTSIRKGLLPIPMEILRRITEIFPSHDSLYSLDPSYEDTNDPTIRFELIEPYANPENVQIFKQIQKLQSVGLVQPHDAPYLYFAAMESKACKLTPLGKHYWELVRDGKL